VFLARKSASDACARALTFIEILGVSGLSTLVRVGILAVNIDILLYLCCGYKR
jgi:hypothetical protein